jgi:alpha-L-fucosidase 2
MQAGAIFGAALLCSGAAASGRPSDLIVWFDAAARHFTQSSPLGNGRLGAMVFGGVVEERIVLNESGAWSGSPQDADRPDAAQYLPEIQRLLLEGRNVDAERLVNDHFTCEGPGSGGAKGKDLPFGCYQTLGNLRLAFPNGAEGDSAVRHYRRELDLGRAIASISYQQGGVSFKREAFVSAPDQTIIIRLTASKPGAITFDARLDRPERFETVADGPTGLLMTGQLNNGTDGKGVRYAARLREINPTSTTQAQE